MRLARVVGSVWATVKDASLEGARLVLAQPVDADLRPVGGPVAALDTVGSGPGEVVLMISSYEAGLPWRDRFPALETVAVDQAVVGIVTRVNGEEAVS